MDFASDDRLAGSSNGRIFTPRRWSTPLTDYRTVGGRRLATHGDARWGGPDPQESFIYLELTVDDIAYNVASDITSDITSDIAHPSAPFRGSPDAGHLSAHELVHRPEVAPAEGK